MKNRNDLYLKCDVLFLADVSETFRKVSINSFELDPAHYLSTPGYSWDAVLRFTTVKLKTDFWDGMLRFTGATLKNDLSY